MAVDKRSKLSIKEFNDKYYNSCTPVVITDATAAWTAHQNWSAALFKNRYADKVVEVGGKDYRMADFISEVEQSNADKPSPYLNEVRITDTFPELMADLHPWFQYTRNDRLKSKLLPQQWGMREGVVELLIGGKGTCFPVLHYDGLHMHTFITQIKGDKEFYFIPPDQTKYLYIADKFSNKSPVSFFKPDLEKHPLFKNVKAEMVVVKEGETIYIPSGWWHTTRLLTLSIAVSINSMNQRKWNDYVADFTNLYYKESKLKNNLIKFYMLGAGQLMSVGEMLGKKS